MTADKYNIIVADDEAIIRKSLHQILSRESHQITLVDDGLKAIDLIRTNNFDLAFIDLKIPGMGGLDILREIKQLSPNTEVVIITGFGTVETAVEAMKNGAYDYISKPFTPETIRLVLKKIIQKKKLFSTSGENQLSIEYGDSSEVIIGFSSKMQEIYDMIRKVAPTDSTVLISGESGTGKELIAKAIHHNSLRKNKPFMTVDCCSLVETLFESELFGHVRGSFTGAIATKHGSFELAHGGTFFFDEISNISLGIQAKILRVIQEREIKRVGATESIKVDVRVIAATNANLRNLVDNGTFREDLFYRLSVIPIHVPSLRERKEDIIPLAHHFLQKYNKRRKRNIDKISEKVQEHLLLHHWPGNVRELENVLERAVVIEDANEISFSSLPTYIKDIRTVQESNHIEIRPLEQIEKEYILKTLTMTAWNRSKTAKLLGIDRKTLYDKIKRYGIQEPDAIDGDKQIT